ncbi:SSI family serine proteinase inhibitor [Kibdelosporangium lantanae]
MVSRSLAVLGAAACTFVLATAPASAAESSLFLSKQGPGVESLVGLPKLATLDCDPAGGTHPAYEDACAVLTRANGDFNKIRPLARVCTMQYSPVNAAVHGTWRGRQVDWKATFPNDCAAGAQTDMVFAF